MSRDIIIQNNGVAVTYTGIKKIKTRKSTGGTLYWLPEGEQPTGTITITENGTYKAEEANLYAFSQAIVNVQKAPTHVTGKGQDGNTYDVTIDPETGEIVQTEVPAKMEITTPPPRVSYNDGDAIDYRGIVVTLYDGNGNVFTDNRYPDGTVPFSELAFPVDKAHYEDDGKWTDGHGLNAQKITYTPVPAVDTYLHEVIAYVGPVIGEREGYPSTYGSFGSSANFLMTRYNGRNYALWINGDKAVNMFTNGPYSDFESIWHLTGGSSAIVRGDRFVSLSFEEFLTELPESTVDPTTVDPTTLHAVQSIPVNWISPYNADTYTDEFDIVVHEESGSAD